ncbi:peptidylprolyl isomerase [Aquisalibacillus elongatus]|uniref:Foldase protein PrsA n=1 Tax=Aquisalibacillus elongatus TaxID=485577 RepID=A0A3N5BRM8_9BACI|nr:peptidylprolyl isomerase [Aquisalibacillus elongatus]RPF50162.1 foldase protein PrsA [Aquisalibacillus elongatus]
MKKVLLILLALGLAVLAACTDDESNQEDEQEDNQEVVAETAAGDITKDEFYEELKELHGEKVLQSMVTRKVLNNELDEDHQVTLEEIDEEIQETKDQLGQQFNQVLQQQGISNEKELRYTLLLSKIQYQLAAQDIEIPEEEIKNRYERLQTEIRARHILVDEEETAQEVIDLYNEGTDFEELVSEYSTDSGSASNGGDLDYFSAGDMVKPFEDAAYALEVGEISEPVQSDFGWHVILIEDKRDADIDSYEEMKDSIEEEMTMKQVDQAALREKVQEKLDQAEIDIQIEEFENLFETTSNS